MSQQCWRAYIVTQSNRLEQVEIYTPNNSRQDAVAQCISMFGAKEVKSINPCPSSGSSSTEQQEIVRHIEPSWTLIGFLALIWIVIIFWPYLLVAGCIFGLYKLIKYLRSSS